MRKISQLLQRFAGLKPGNGYIEQEAKKAIKEILKIENVGFEVRYKKPYLVVMSPNAAFKNEIFLKKEDIQKTIRESTGNKIPVNLFFG